MLSVDWSTPVESRSAVGRSFVPTVSVGMFGAVRRLWCRHSSTVVTPKQSGMPAHIVCTSCGLREPVMASTPHATRTWDSTRDEARYQRDKRRRVELEARRHAVAAEVALPTARHGATRRDARKSNLYDLNRVHG